MGEFIDEHRAGKPVVFGGARAQAARQPPRDRARRFCRRCAERCRRIDASSRTSPTLTRRSTFAGSRWASALEPARHELPRSLSPHAHLSVLRRLGSGDGHGRDAEGRDSRAGRRLPERVPAVLRLVRDAGFAEAARLESVGRHHPRRRAVRLRQEQEGSAHHHRVLPQRHQRDGGRNRARDGRPEGRHYGNRRAGTRRARVRSADLSEPGT